MMWDQRLLWPVLFWSGNGKLYLVPFPGSDAEEISQPQVLLHLNHAEMERFLHQSDVLDVVGAGKAILRKSQRHIDRQIQWKVFERDGYRCRYCGRRAPLTVDHVILWENGGASVEENLISACGPCNKRRGNMEYDRWINSREYAKVSHSLTLLEKAVNAGVVLRLDELRAIQTKTRSR